MKFKAVTPSGNIAMPFTSIKELEDFINGAFEDKVRRSEHKLDGLKVYPQKIEITIEEGEFVKANVLMSLNVICTEGNQ